jgi:hypothetical protein
MTFVEEADNCELETRDSVVEIDEAVQELIYRKRVSPSHIFYALTYEMELMKIHMLWLGEDKHVINNIAASAKASAADTIRKIELERKRR